MKRLISSTLAIFSALLSAEEPRKSNILFILTDDQSPFDLKFHNPESTLDSPVIDGLASGGMVFDAAYHMGSFSGAVCTPSRHMISSGRTVWHLPISPGEKKCPPVLEQNTIGPVFKRAGYATMRTSVSKATATPPPTSSTMSSMTPPSAEAVPNQEALGMPNACSIT